ncbi:MAG: DUF945 domain-containing protein [Candidatus Omnitrophica bacterium]|nr:DUF945 domain-containing protein [Candidatus Omnitrophota bacterium]
MNVITHHGQMSHTRNLRPLTDAELQRYAPSVFAKEPWHERTDKYRFVPTIDVVNALRDHGIVPVRAYQSSSRIEGKGEYTKHMIRFRMSGDYDRLQVGDTVPEVVLINSHDGACAYRLTMGLFRLACSNGMMVNDQTIGNMSVRHIGNADLREGVIDATMEIVKEAPKVLDRIGEWGRITLDREEQIEMADRALTAYDSAIQLRPDRLLHVRRREDYPEADGTRDLWRTFNVIHENLIRGGVYGRSTSGRRQRTREVRSIDRNVSLNQSLYGIAQEMAELRGEAPGNGRVIRVARFEDAAAPVEVRDTRTPFEQCRDLFAKYGPAWTQHTAELTY